MSINPQKPGLVLLSPKQAALYLGISIRQLAMDRHLARANGTSPKYPYYRLGHRTIKYNKNDLRVVVAAGRVE